MATEITLPKGFGAVSSVFGGQTASNDELGQGVMSSYGIMGFKGKVWTTRYQGTDTPLMRDDGDGPRGSIEVVLVKASPAISKIFYKNGYVDGSNAAPDCWSANGQKPDASVQAKVHATCADCPMNAWGSRVTDAGKPGKACSDSRRVAIVPVADIDNELLGGPMLLRIPAASLKDLKAYGDLLNGYNYPYYAVATRISFDAKEAYPKFVFSAIRPLTDDEARKVLAMRDDKRVGQVLSEAQEVQQAAQQQAQVPASPFEQGQAASQPLSQQAAARGPAQQPQQQAQKPPANPFGGAAPAQQKSAPEQAKTTAASPASTPAPDELDEALDEVMDSGDDSAAAGAPASFDAMLESMI